MQKQPTVNQSKQKTKNPNNFMIQRKDKDLSISEFHIHSEEFCDNKPALLHIKIISKNVFYIFLA